MTAAASLQREPERWTLVLSTVHLSTIARIIEVSYLEGHPPVVDIRRESSTGARVGLIRIFDTHQRVLRSAIDAAKRGELGAHVAPMRTGSLSFDVRSPCLIAIGLLGAEGQPRGGTSVILGEELERLDEALCIAARWREGEQ